MRVASPRKGSLSRSDLTFVFVDSQVVAIRSDANAPHPSTIEVVGKSAAEKCMDEIGRPCPSRASIGAGPVSSPARPVVSQSAGAARTARGSATGGGPTWTPIDRPTECQVGTGSARRWISCGGRRLPAEGGSRRADRFARSWLAQGSSRGPRTRPGVGVSSARDGPPCVRAPRPPAPRGRAGRAGGRGPGRGCGRSTRGESARTDFGRAGARRGGSWPR